MEFELIEAPNTELAFPERAQVALNSQKHRQELAILVAESKTIVSVQSSDERAQAHAAAMKLKNTRCSIVNAGEAAREDAVKFSKAILAEQKTLIDLITPEEDRVFALRDAFDAKVKAECDAAIAAVRARLDKHRANIDEIRDLITLAIDSTSESIQSLINRLEKLVVTVETFEEFAEQAATAKSETMAKLVDLHARAVTAETAEAQRLADIKADQERMAAERLKIEQEKSRLAELAAEQERIAKAQRDQHAAEMARQQAEIDAQRVAAEKEISERMAAAEAIQRAEQARIAQELQAEREKLAQQRAEFDALKNIDQAKYEAVQENQPGSDLANSLIEESTIETLVEPILPMTPTMTIGKLCRWLGFTVNAEFLNSLGFTAQTVHNAKLYHESDKPSIRAALIRHLQQLDTTQAA